jgi:hypothetical protein
MRTGIIPFMSTHELDLTQPAALSLADNCVARKTCRRAVGVLLGLA